MSKSKSSRQKAKDKANMHSILAEMCEQIINAKSAVIGLSMVSSQKERAGLLQVRDGLNQALDGICKGYPTLSVKYKYAIEDTPAMQFYNSLKNIADDNQINHKAFGCCNTDEPAGEPV